MDKNIIELTNIFKGYKEKQILQQLNLSVPQGSVLGLLGKNGAGKTTLIKCMLGLLRCDQGQVKVLGDDPWHFQETTKEKLGYVPQSDRIYPWLTVQQLIDYTSSFYPHWNTALVDKLVNDWELDLNDKVGLLSEGQAQKLSIILSLGHEPELLVFDEPVASLDPAARRQFLKTILEIVGDRPCTVFFSTHITSDLERVADRVAILKKGQIHFCGELDVLKDEVKRLRITIPQGMTPNIKGDGILHCDQSPGQAILTVRGFDHQVKAHIEKNLGTSVQVDIEDLNLEEIFLELTR